MGRRVGKLHLLQWNIRGYYNNLASLQILISRYDPDVILLQETKLRDVRPKSLGVYDIYHHNGNYDSNRGGIAILVKSSIPHEEVALRTNLLANAVRLRVGQNVTICNVYLERDLYLGSRDLKGLIQQLSGSAFIGGDFNAHSTLWGSNNTDRRGRIIVDTVREENLVILNDKSDTHFSTLGTYTAIDISMATPTLAQGLEWYLHQDLECSDHFPILVASDIEIAKVRKTARYVEARADWEKYQETVGLLLRRREPKSSINAEAASLRRVIREAAEVAIPVAHGGNKTKPCWFTEEIQRAREDRAAKLAEHRRRPNNTTHRLLKEANASVKRLIGEAKRRSWTEFSERIDLSTDVRGAWARVRACTGKRRETYIPMIRTGTGEVCTNSAEMANIFNVEHVKYSSNRQYTANITREKRDLLEEARDTGAATGKLTYPITATELGGRLARLRGKTPGLDRISYQMLRKAGPGFLLRLMELYNRILEKGIYPHTWKHAAAQPIPKPGAGANRTARNFRPISFLSCMSKVLEGILAERLQQIIRHKLPEEIHGFRPGRGTESLLLHVEGELSDWLDAGEHGMLLSLDIQKAYERVGVTVVAGRLRKWGLDAPSIRLVVNFMSNRTITTRVNGHQSVPLRLDNGLPQGSPLSPVLFLVYTADMIDHLGELPGIKTVVYADNLYIMAKGEGAVDELVCAKIILEDWCQKVGAIIPEGSGELLHVCRRHSCNVRGGTNTDLGLVVSEHIKILGVFFSRSLRWNRQVRHLRDRIDSLLGLMRTLTAKNSQVPPVALRKIAKTLLRGICGYAATIYGAAPATVLKTLETAVNRVIRLALEAFHTTPTIAMGVEMGFTVRELIKERRISLVAKGLINPGSHHHELVRNCVDRATRRRKPSAIHLAWETYTLGGGPVPNIENAPKVIVTGRELDNLRITIFQNMDSFSTPNEAWLARYREWRSARPYLKIIFTDASADGDKTTVAAVTKGIRGYDTVFRQELDQETTASIAELYAIYRVVKDLEGTSEDTVILSDSLGSVKAIFNPRNQRYMPTWIREKLIYNAGKIRIGWVPGHKGIEGNERADREAKRFNGTGDRITPPSETFCRHKALRGERDGRRRVWAMTDTFLREHWEEPEAPTLNPSLDRGRARALTRMRLGHTRLTKGHLMEGSQPPRCQTCEVPQTVKHILRECRETRMHFGGNVPPIGELLDPGQGTDSPLFGLLEQRNLLHQI